MGVDQRGQARRLAREPREYDPALALAHEGRKQLARIARRIAALENHFMPFRLEALDPARERRRTIEKRRIVDASDECDRKSDLPRMVQHAPAIRQREADVANGQQARRRFVFLLHVDEHHSRDRRCICEGPETDDRCHAAPRSTDGRVTARERDCSRIPGRCQRPSGLMVRYGSIPMVTAFARRSVNICIST